MQSDIHHSGHKDAKAANESATSFPAPNRLARRSFLRNIGIGAALLAPGAALLSSSAKALAKNGNEKEKNTLTRGDVAILQLLAAAELIETDLWQQYNELGGVNAPDSGYKAGLVILDGDQPQYIADNTDDEISHAAFLNAYLKSKGEQEVDLSHFATLAPSQVSFVPQTGRLTNLKQLTVDTSWWTRYRSIRNPDFGATFANAVPSLHTGQHTAIPRDNAELGDPNNPSDHVKAIAFTAGKLLEPRTFGSEPFRNSRFGKRGKIAKVSNAPKVERLQDLRHLVGFDASQSEIQSFKR